MNIIFIITDPTNTNTLKRIDEFVERGYKVKVYGFDRDTNVKNQSKYVKIEMIGGFSNNLPYAKRIKTIRNGINSVLREHQHEKCLYYLRGLDIAIVFRFCTRKPYIFEEADLVHTYMNNSYARKAFEVADKWVIKGSFLSVFRSEGFPIYHFGKKVPGNCHVIPNRLNKGILDYQTLPKEPLDINHIKFGFVGVIRFESIFNFAKVVSDRFPQHEFHFYGSTPSDADAQMFSSLEGKQNVFFHGRFKSPEDLPAIYNKVDVILSTYDVKYENVRYAEPNKIYEAMYFETPIIVSSGTFLADKVNRLGIGFDIDATDDSSVENFINNLTTERIQAKEDAAKAVAKSELINVNDSFFNLLNQKLNE